MEQQAATLLATLKKPALQSDAKLTALNALKSEIKHCRVPENAQATIFDCIKLAITQQASSTIAAAGFSTFGHLIKRLKIQDPTGATISHLAPRLYGAITERLGDLREPIRISASSVLTEIWPLLGEDVERIIREDALSGTNARAREAAMLWVVRMHQDEHMPFKSFVAPIVANLEEADGTTREAAKTALIDLFRDAPERAKVDLRRQLKAHSVRHSIESQILDQIGASGTSKPEQDHGRSTSRPPPARDFASQLSDIINSEAAQPPPQEVVQMEPINVYSEREVNELFRDMLPYFEGKETEQNWMTRDKSILKLRRVLQGNAPLEYQHAFMVGIKSMVEGILKVANSLRTTMSTNGCQFVQELARTLGPVMDPHVEILLQSFIKMSSNTKHIAAENGKNTADAIFQNCSYNVRMMQHIWNAVQEKNAQIRQCTPQWLKTILRRQASYKTHFESSGGAELAEKSIRKGLDDANPKVKEATRATYWIFAKTWPERADSIINKLDTKSRTLLEKDSNNPNSALFQSSVSSAAPSRARTPATTGRTALKAMMDEQRRAKSAGRNVAERSNSAMATVSPTKKHDSHARAPSRLRENRVASNTSTTSTSTSKGSALMSGPVRRPPRKPEIQRPLTADPYASRRMHRPETPSDIATTSSPKASISKLKSSIPSPTTTHHNHPRHEIASTENSPSSVRKTASSSFRPASKDGISRPDDTTRTPQLRRPQSSIIMRSLDERPASSSNSLADVAENDDHAFSHSRSSSHTLSQRAMSPDIHRSPLKAMIDAAREKLDRPVSSSSNQPHHARLDDPFDVNAVQPRQRSPVKSAQRDVQIYEDIDGDIPAEQSNGTQKVLSELPVNENVRMQSPTLSNGSSNSNTAIDGQVAAQASMSPKRKADSQRDHRLLVSGIERIRSRTLDPHGFRRVQDLAKSTSPDLWDNGQKFDELMTALLAYLPAFEHDPKLTSLPSAKAVGLKVQAMSVVRAMINVHQKLARSWYERVLETILTCRARVFEGAHGHFVNDLVHTANDVVRLASVQPCINAIQNYLSQASQRTVDVDEKTARTVSASVAMALSYSGALIVDDNKRHELDINQKKQLAKLASQHLENDDADVRNKAVDLACKVHGLFHEPGQEQSKNADFWDNFETIDHSRMALLTYFIAKARNQQQS